MFSLQGCFVTSIGGLAMFRDVLLPLHVAWLCLGMFCYLCRWPGYVQGCFVTSTVGLAMFRDVLLPLQLAWLCLGMFCYLYRWPGCAQGCFVTSTRGLAMFRDILLPLQVTWLCLGMFCYLYRWPGSPLYPAHDGWTTSQRNHLVNEKTTTKYGFFFSIIFSKMATPNFFFSIQYSPQRSFEK